MHVGEVWEVRKRGKLPLVVDHLCESGYVKLRFLEKGDENYTELTPGEYGPQQKWVVLNHRQPQLAQGEQQRLATLGALAVVKLRAALKQLDLDTTGLEAELVSRLREAQTTAEREGEELQ
jgi:hypothetical protein